MEYKRKRLIRAALQKAEAKRKQTVRQAESAADTEQQTPEEYAQTVVSEKAAQAAENLQSKALDTGRISYRQFRILQEKRQRVPTTHAAQPAETESPPFAQSADRRESFKRQRFRQKALDKREIKTPDSYRDKMQALKRQHLTRETVRRHLQKQAGGTVLGSGVRLPDTVPAFSGGIRQAALGRIRTLLQAAWLRLKAILTRTIRRAAGSLLALLGAGGVVLLLAMVIGAAAAVIGSPMGILFADESGDPNSIRIHYNFFLLEGVSYLFLFSKIYGYDFGQESTAIFERMFEKAYEYAFDNLYLPNPNDGWPNLNLRTFSYVYHTAARAFGEKSKVGNLLKIIENDPNPRTTLPLSEPYYCCGTVCLEQLLFNIDFDYSDYRPVAHVSNTFPTSNFAMLRNNNWNVFVKYGLNGKSHAHPDIMNIEVMYKDQRISRDLSNAGYQSRLCNEWHRKTLSHNTVCWNGQDITSVHPGKCLHFDADSFSGLALDVYEGIDYQRNLHITEDSLVDEFLVQGKPGVYDYVFHLEPQLQLECEMPLEDASLGFSENGYQHVEETKKVLVLGDKAVLWAVFGELRMKIELQLENGQELFLLKTKDNPVNQTRRSILVRARGEKVRYSMQLTV